MAGHRPLGTIYPILILPEGIEPNGRSGEQLTKPEDSELEREVAGEYNTWRTYLYMLKVRDSSSRDVQNALGFSSPTLAQHHLEKLRRYGLASKGHNGTYHVIPRSFGILRLYIKNGRWIVPRTTFFVIIFALLSVGFTLSLPQHGFFLYALLLSIAGLAYALYETFQFYRVLPRD